MELRITLRPVTSWYFLLRQNKSQNNGKMKSFAVRYLRWVFIANLLIKSLDKIPSVINVSGQLMSHKSRMVLKSTHVTRERRTFGWHISCIIKITLRFDRSLNIAKCVLITSPSIGIVFNQGFHILNNGSLNPVFIFQKDKI